MQPNSISEDDLYRMLESVVTRIKQEIGVTRDKWVDGEEAMRYMRITSRTTLQKLRDTGAIRFSQILPKHILYDLDSIDEYLKKHSNR